MKAVIWWKKIEINDPKELNLTTREGVPIAVAINGGG
jgi:hypothetical protein